jgi:hypothetical protein
MATTPITSQVIRDAVRGQVAQVLPKGSAVILQAIGRRDDARIAAQVRFRFPAQNGYTFTAYAVAVLDGPNVEQVEWSRTDAQADIDFMRVAL